MASFNTPFSLFRRLLPPGPARDEWDGAQWAFFRTIFFVAFVGIAIGGMVVLWSIDQSFGAAATMIVGGSLIYGAVNLVRRSRQQHLAHEAMLRELNAGKRPEAD